MTVQRAIAALSGFALALWMSPSLQRPASPGQLPGAMTAAGLDSAGPIEQFVFIAAMTFLAAAIPSLWRRPAAERLTWRRAPKLDDVAALATLLPLYFAALDLWQLKPAWLLVCAAALILAVRFFVPATAFALAPLALVLQVGWLPKRPAAIAALAWIVVTPFLLRRRNTRRLIPWVYAVVSFAYSLTLLGIASPPYLDFFEDGHELVTAAELARGERPYVDIVPVHGLLSDGGLDWLVLKSGASSAGSILKA